MNKNLLRFLQFRDSTKDVSQFEKESDIVLPPIFKAFVCNYEPYFAHQKIKRDNSDEFQSFIVPIYCTSELAEYTIDDDELSLESFKEVEDVFTFNRSNDGYLKDYLFIANHGYSGGLLVGIGEGNKDKIYHNTDSTEITFIAENIFEFLSRIQLVQYDFDEPNINTSQLYQNWGEDFWRLKE